VNDAAHVLSELARHPAGAVLLEVAEAHEGVHLVGGAVRDHLLGRVPRELDVAVQGDALELAGELAERLGGGLVSHERFGTATVDSAAGRIDLAATRAEHYTEPGALPEVELGVDLARDLTRRDFTVNALAVTISGGGRGALHAPDGALEDLENARLRALHDASFSDDPTRLLRLARYAHRLGFTVEKHTARLVERALAAGALHAVSGARLGADLRLALGQGALGELERLGMLARLRVGLRADVDLLDRAQALLGDEARLDLLALAAAALGQERESLRAWLDQLEFPARDRDAVLDAVAEAPALAVALSGIERGSEIHAMLAGRSPEAVALAGALGAEAKVRRWLEQLRLVRLEITGDDLIAAGVPGGPEIGRRLELALAQRLDEQIPSGREAELRAALAE
jgi:tRNA nucleotidyltransferase (CCA-adding enzyme)